MICDQKTRNAVYFSRKQTIHVWPLSTVRRIKISPQGLNEARRTFSYRGCKTTFCIQYRNLRRQWQTRVSLKSASSFLFWLDWVFFAWLGVHLAPTRASRLSQLESYADSAKTPESGPSQPRLVIRPDRPSFWTMLWKQCCKQLSPKSSDATLFILQSSLKSSKRLLALCWAISEPSTVSSRSLRIGPLRMISMYFSLELLHNERRMLTVRF